MPPAAPAAPPRGDRLALRVVQLGALAVVLVALPYKAFDLDRYFVPKELALHVTALVAALACIAGRRKLALAWIDLLLAAFVVLSAASAVLATNYWLAGRALAVTCAGAALFWVGRALARDGLARPIIAAMGFAAALGAVTALLQAYGVDSPYFSLSRAPGGTFGNRNFVAHIGAIAIPVLLLATLTARRSIGVLAGAVATGVVAAMLVLSRSRAAWLAIALSVAPMALIALMLRGRWRGVGIGRRAFMIGIVGIVAIGLAIALPNALEWKSDSPYLDSVKGVVNYKQGSGRGRLVQYTNSLRIAAAHPVLGVGPGNWAVVYPRYATHDDPSLDSSGMTANPWPSSDLVAFISERGLPAFGALVLLLIALLVDAVAQVIRSKSSDELFRGLALGGTIVATIVAGAFDAALLLAAPALIAWTLFGVLAEPRRASIVTIGGGVRDWAPVLALVVLGAGVAHSALQVGAMNTFNASNRASAYEQASRLDPGDYRIHMRLAQAYVDRGQCTRALPHARSAHALYPAAAAPRRLLASCGERVRAR